MPEAKDGEVTIVEVESVGFNKTKVKDGQDDDNAIHGPDLSCFPK